MMLDHRFPLYSPTSRQLYYFDDTGTQRQLSAELRRTSDALAASLPGRVTKGTLTDAEAKQLLVQWLAITEDLEAQDQWLANNCAGHSLDYRLKRLRERNGVAWERKIEVLRRELEARRAGYPAEVDKGRLTRDDARLQLERLEAVHELYWRWGFGFDGTKEELRAHSDALLDATAAAEREAA